MIAAMLPLAPRMITFFVIASPLGEPIAPNSRLNHHFDRFALIHCAVTIWQTFEVGDAVKHAARLYSAFEHVRQELIYVIPMFFYRPALI